MAYGFTYTLPTIIGSHTDFRLVLKTVDFPAAAIDASANSFTTGGGEIIAYTDDTKTTQLPIDVVTFISSATVPKAEVWIKIGTAATGGTIYLEKDATQTTQPAVGTTYGRNAVWSSAYYVGHMQGSSPINSADGTVGTLFGTYTADATGKIGSAVDYGTARDGGLDTNQTFVSLPSFSASVWAEWSGTSDANEETLIALWGAAGSDFQMRYDSSGGFMEAYIWDGIQRGGTFASSNALATAGFHKITLDYNGTVAKMYLDGVVSSTDVFLTGTIGDGVSENLHIGHRGTLDEFRGLIGHTTLDITRSADWHTTEYDNQSASIAWGAVGTYADASPSATITSVGGDDVVLDAEQNVSFVTSGFSGEISTVQLVSGTSITTINPASINSTGGSGDFDLIDISALTSPTVGAPLTTANNIVVARLTDA